jgi:hypothetical protein
MGELQHLVCIGHWAELGPEIGTTLVGEPVDGACCFCDEPADQLVTILVTPKDCQHLQVAGRP